ncbi:MAG: hypothetical protein C4523_10805 [Myxococcales bacterium]|jgi:hypothetical protein|nr:MAG: hypothetical protein C4523_10805 [Myxococcales bacterium]
MAVTTQYSTEYDQAYVDVPPTLLNTTELHGRVRVAYITHAQSGAGDATSSVALCKLPPGRVRLLLGSSFFYVNWTTASATLDLGWDAYTAMDGTTTAADPNGLADGIDVDTVGLRSGEDLVTLAAIQATGGTKLFESKDGVVIRATSQDTAIADGDDLVGYLLYVVD